MSLKRASEHDKRGLIAESYYIDDLGDDGARAIFLDWAMMDCGDDPMLAMSALWTLHGESIPQHPMSLLLRQGIDNLNERKAVGRRRRSR